MHESTEVETDSTKQNPAAMTFAQAMHFVVYLTIGEAVLAAVAGLALRFFVGLDTHLSGLLLLFGLLGCCGPVIAAMIYWSRAACHRPWVCAIRFGLSMSIIVMLYAGIVTLSAGRLGVPAISALAFEGYCETVIVSVLPISTLVTYVLRKRRMGAG